MAINKEKLVLQGLRGLLNGTARMTRRGAGRIGYWLLSNPRRLADDHNEDAFMKEAECESVDLLGNTIHTYHWPGDGPSVLLLHGWESSTARWHALIPGLRQSGYDVYAIDAPAHGRSSGRHFNVLFYCDTLRAYFERRGAVQDVWIGHSAGGMACIYYASQERFEHRPKDMICMAVPGELEDFINKFCDFVGVSERVKYGIEQRFMRKFAEAVFGHQFQRVRQRPAGAGATYSRRGG